MSEPRRTSATRDGDRRATGAARSGLLRALEAATSAHPTTRKRLVGPDINFGREYLSALARATGGWVGWEAANLITIAGELAFVPLAEQGLRRGSDVEIGALVNQALDRAIASGRVSTRFAALERSLGFRRSLIDSLLELRTGGVSAKMLRDNVAPGSPPHDLPAVLVEYERLLQRHGVVDPAGLFRAALDAFDREAPYVLDGVMVIAPTLVARGLPGQLLERLLARGALHLAADPVIGMEPPTQLLGRVALERDLPPVGEREVRDAGCSVLAWLTATELPAADEPRLDRAAVHTDLFSAATPTEELREVCRRVMAEGLRWDEVEIVATDVDAYGIALDALCQQLGVGATMLHGVPLARTRLGRAVDRWLAWLDDGLPADVLRQALEAGELRPPDHEIAPTALARELRQLRIGWGRGRYEAALRALDDGHRLEVLAPREDESEEEFATRRESRRRGAAALLAFLRALLAATPEVPERGSERPVRGTCSSLASATLAWLDLVALHDVAEQQTAARLRTRLEQLADVEDAETSFSSALAALREGIADLRAWPMLTEDRKPWSAAGGMLHLTDVAHAGTTGRARVFVVGLDAGRTQGGARQDPLLPDAARRAVAPDALATSTVRRDESAFALAFALASLRGRVTLSYATSGSLDGREAGPSPLLLQAWRIARGDVTLSYESLRDALRPPASAVPGRRADGALAGISFLDARDVWLDAIADGPLLLDADSLVRAAFPMLGDGLRAAELAQGTVLTGFHGLVPQAGSVLGANAGTGREISPSALEKLAACPLSWFYRYALALYLPDDPDYDAESWLNALERGSLLHEVFESFVRAFQGRQQEIRDEAALVSMLALTDAAIARWRDAVPPPGEAVFDSEAAELRQAAMAFLHMERDLAARGDDGTWLHVEYEFGAGAPPGPYHVTDGRTILVKGRADRVDELPDRTLRVIDYKTGGSSRYARKPKAGPFNGGRQLQPALYASVIEALLGRPVSRFEYRFPTAGGGNDIVPYSAEELAAARAIIAGLLDHVSAGAFVPTTDSEDCRYCDHRAICRVHHRESDHRTDSPRAAWAEEHAPDLDAYATMLARREPA